MSLTRFFSAAALATLAASAQAGTFNVTSGANDNAAAQGISFSAAAAGGAVLNNYVEQGVTFNGGRVYDVSARGVGAQPFGGTTNFVAMGPSTPLTVSFATGTTYFSFLWGSTDTHNTLEVTTNLGTTSYIPGQGGMPTQNPSWSNAIYFNWHAGVGETVTSLRLTATGQAFEVDNFSVQAVSAIPEPATSAMLLAGLAVLGSMARRRKIG